MLVTESRPRNLKWFHAGPLLYGDWGTSRLYVLGLAFFYTAHSSVIYLAAIGLLMLAVSWVYTIVCKAFPDGGGVYTAARQLSPTLSVIGSTLLLSGYIMTAAISVIEAFHYFGVPHGLVLPLAIVAIVLIGGINWLGAKSAGQFAMVIAFAALGVSAVMALLCLPFFFKGLQTISLDYFREAPPTDIWVNFTKICLALAGVEAVANMTGLMKKPVGRESKRTIWPVAIEVVALNMLFGIALAGLSFSVHGEGLIDVHTPHAVMEAAGALPTEALHEVEQYTNASMKIIATESGEQFLGPRGGSVLGTIAGITFGLLLLSATNTAIMAMVSVFFAMGQDEELPRPLTKLNYSGVPWVGLVVSVVIPIAVIAITQNVTLLAKLYVLGVCGAITVTALSCAFNGKLEITKAQRTGIAIIGFFLLAISLTIAITQPISTVFSGVLVGGVLAMRWGLKSRLKKESAPLDRPEAGWIEHVRNQKIEIDPNKPKIMLAARGRFQSEFAVDLAKRREATLFAIFVRTLRVMDIQPGRIPTIETDTNAQESLGTTALLAKDAGVPFIPIYVTSPDIADEILDHTVTYGCDTLIMGKSLRSVFARRFEGDVVSTVAEGLPDEIALISRSAETRHASKEEAK